MSRGDKATPHHQGAFGTYRFEEIPLMQLLEKGFVRNDAMPGSSGDAGKMEVFNGEVVAELAKHGFYPGAAFGDTMHFDYIAGYNHSVPGGRSPENMDHSRYSPEGPLPSACEKPLKGEPSP